MGIRAAMMMTTTGQVPRVPRVPLLCDDILLYAYQLFRARESGADAVRFLAVALSSQDLLYLCRTALALGLEPLVTVGSLPQLLSALRVPGLRLISVTGRNALLWRVDPNKAATGILAHPDAVAALTLLRERSPDSASRLLLGREGFTSPAQMREALREGADFVVLGEELLQPGGAEEADKEEVSEEEVLARLENWLQRP